MNRWFEYEDKIINLNHVVHFKVVEYAQGWHLICIMNATIQYIFDESGNERCQEDYFLKYFHRKEDALQVARDIVEGKHDIPVGTGR